MNRLASGRVHLRPLASAAALVLLTCGAPASAAGPATVLIVKSDSLPQYESPIAVFRKTISFPSTIINIEGSPKKGTALLNRAAAEEKPIAIFALGAQAAWLSRQTLPDVPLVFAMVLGWQRYGLAHGPTTGVSLDIPADATFTRFKLMLPALKTVGVIYSTACSQKMVDNARDAARRLGLGLVEEQVAYSSDVPGAYRRMRTRVDGLWMVPDPVVITLDNFEYLAERTRNDGIAFLAFSENFVRAGALLSVSPNYTTIGSQAAVLTERLLADQNSPPAVQPPVGSKLVLNSSTARILGFEFNALQISMADLVVAGPAKEE